jgi:NADPH-dependent 2,4-dienoyl-CoA reductase/sulfur reductase-like enzyme/bacterioferritin-associated ferredoxin
VEERTDEAQAGSATGEAQAAEQTPAHRSGSPYQEDVEREETTEQTLVVVGNGMMGFRLCQKLVECGANQVLKIVVFGEEPRPAYDRVHLTELFSGQTPESLTLAPEEWYFDNGIDLNLGDPIVEIDREDCIVRSASGLEVPYDRLVFATGSRPFVPPIEGKDLPGVFVYRTVEHLEAIREYRDGPGVTRAAVIGGGLLGLEAAKAVYDLGLEVCVVEVAPGLMPRQLDAQGAGVLKDKIEQLGVRVHLSKQTTRIEDAAARQGPFRAPLTRERILHFSDGSPLAVDMVVISAGIRPQGEIAAAAGLTLAKNGGIIVDDHLTTSDPRIFAVGECAVHRGTTYGLAFPGYKMVDVLVDNLVGGTASFEGADQSAKLKLLGVSVASMGEHNEKDVPNSTVHSFCANGDYRKLVMRDGKIVGAISVGEWDNLDRVREAIEQPRLVSFWDMRRFRSTGNLWLKSESPPIGEWPEDALVCGCLRVNRGTLSQAQLDGCFTVEELCSRTGAGTMCGSCKPLIAELLGGSRDSVPPSMRGDAVPSSMRMPPASVRGAPISRRYSQPPSSGGTASGPPSVRASGALGRYRSVVPSSNAPIALVRRTPTPVAPVPAAELEAAEPESSDPSSDTGPVSVRGSMLPQPRTRRSLYPSAPIARVEAAGPLRREHEGLEIDAPPRSGASRPPSMRPSFKPPERISFTEDDVAGDEDRGPISVRSPNTRDVISSGRSASARPAPRSNRPSKVPSIGPSTSKRLSVGPVELRSIEVRPADKTPSGHPQILPPEPEQQGDSILPPPDSAPASLRDVVPSSVREHASLRLRDPGSRLLREAARFSADMEGEEHEPAPHALRGRDLTPGPGRTAPTSDVPSSGRVRRDSAAPVSSSRNSKSDSGPPSRRRDSLPPLRPISVPPVRGAAAPRQASIPPGRLTAPLARAQVSAERGRWVLLGASVFALVAVVVVAMGPLPVRRSSLGTHIDVLWTSNAGKQVTGYVVVALGLASLVLSPRRRWERFTWIFRALHASLGAAALVALSLHTGLHLGQNLNRLLMYDFLALTLLGAAAGGVTALSHWFSLRTASKQHDLWKRAHLILFLPLPVLLALHIFGAYYY